MTVRRIAVVVSTLLVVLGLAAPSWAQYPPQQPTCQVNQTTASPGDQITVSGDNWQPNGPMGIRIRFRQDNVSQEYGPFPIDSSGHFSAQITVPMNAQDGPAKIAVGGPDQTGERTQCNLSITITGGGPGPGTGTFCEIDDATPAPGQEVKVTGRKWEPKSTVTVRFVQDANNQVMGTANVNGAGRFAKHLAIPADADPGPAQVRVEGTDENGDPATCVINITVSASASARSMSVAAPFTPATVALLLGTVGTVLVTRRRRTRALVRSSAR